MDGMDDTYANLLNEVVVYARSSPDCGRKLSVRFRRITVMSDMLTDSTETVQKGRRYIGISEAVLDVSKTALFNRISIMIKYMQWKARRLFSQKASDTLVSSERWQAP